MHKPKLKKSNDKTICLVMIVKNESKIIERMLDSLKPILDFVCITDTGSTYNTVEIIRAWGASNNIETTVCQDNFVNFAVSRTKSFRNAKENYPKADYFLLSDADFVWEISPRFDKSFLFKPSYSVEQRNEVIKYRNTRLISSRLDWECKGVTHEFWKSPKNETAVKISSLKIDDKGDGGCKAEKFTRDIKLLKEALENPGDEEEYVLIRYKFYLAQSYRDTNQLEKAIHWYKECARGQRWDEEVYFSFFSIGECYSRLYVQKKDPKDLVESVIFYLMAYKYRPTRAEALGRCVETFDSIKCYDIMIKLCLLGVKIKYPNDTLFVYPRYYDGFFDTELYLGYYYSGDIEKGSEIISDILNNKKKYSEITVKTAENNAGWFI